MHDPVHHTNFNGARFVLILLLCEYVLMAVSGVSFTGLHGNTFFSIGVDPASWLLYIMNIPPFILQHQWMGLMMDAAIIVLLVRLIIYPGRNKTALVLFVLMFCYYITLTGYHTHRNYQSGLFVCLFPFIFRRQKSRELGYEATRYFLLFFYLSAAALKLYYHSLTHTTGFSQFLAEQFMPYYLEGNTGARTALNTYLVGHPSLSYTLYLGSFLVECSMLVGFFTKRCDKWLGILLLLFHVCNWVIMDIGPIGQLAFISLLFAGRYFKATD